jgi:hypothetical protein
LFIKKHRQSQLKAAMQIRHLKINNFRGISSMLWAPRDPFCCLIGAGDSGKSTILDAAEAALNSRWFSFSESDFFACDTSNTIQIEVTVGELSRALKSDERFGLYIQGWTPAGKLRDEPEGDDEPVLTVRLTVDATLEPVWELVCDRVETPRTISNRDRALFGLVRLAGDDARHLAWGQGSVLSRLTGDNKEAATRLAEAYRAARASAKLEEIESLATTATAAEGFAKGLGAYVEGHYEPGLELGRSGLSSGSIALHDDGVPLRLAGLGTRRLATLAIQKSAISEGAIILVDEIEHGLEPHRIIGAISQLKTTQSMAAAAGAPVGQVLLTTHSDIALAESGAQSLHVIHTFRPARVTTAKKTEAPVPIATLMRFTPRALFARRILVCEGMTEVGLLLGVREQWPGRHQGKPIEQLGVALADGNGAQAPEMALALAGLGYPTALFMDSDVPLTPLTTATLAAAGVLVYEYGNMLNTEQAIFMAASDQRIQELLTIARENHGEESVNGALFPRIGLTHLTVREHFQNWELNCALNAGQLRTVVADVAKNKKWFKEQRYGRQIGPIIWSIMGENNPAPLTQILLRLEAWAYA